MLKLGAEGITYASDTATNQKNAKPIRWFLELGRRFDELNLSSRRIVADNLAFDSSAMSV